MSSQPNVSANPLIDNVSMQPSMAASEKAVHALARPDANEFPDGGLEAWLVVTGGFCTVFASFGWINCEASRTPSSLTN